MSARVVVAGGVAIERLVRYDGPGPDGLRVADSLAVWVGGTCALAAVAASAAGAVARCVSVVGSDPAGAVARRALARADVDVTTVRPVPGETARLLRAAPVPPEIGRPGGIGGAWVGARRADERGTTVLPGASWGVARWDPEADLSGCHPGDVLLLDGTALPRARPLVDAAYERDLQIVALLTPYPPTLDHAPLDRIDVVVADQAGAAALADGGFLPASLCVVIGTVGLSWDGDTTLTPGGPVAAPYESTGLPSDAHEDVDAARLPDRTAAVLAGTLAAHLAAGDDRPEAAAAALTAAARVLPHVPAYPQLRLAEEDLG